MTKQELALSNFAQRISTSHLTVAIGEDLSYGNDPIELKFKLRLLQQLHKLFDYEYGIVDSSLVILTKTVTVINTLLNNFRLNGEYTVIEVEIAPQAAKYANFILVGNGSGSGEINSFEYIIEHNGNVSV